MTFSIELLPAPFGPMIARISCSRTSNEMSVSAFTPPNASEIDSSARTTSPIRLPPVAVAPAAPPAPVSPAAACGHWSGCIGQRVEGLRVADHEVRLDRAASPVLELDLGRDVLCAAPAV